MKSLTPYNPSAHLPHHIKRIIDYDIEERLYESNYEENGAFWFDTIESRYIFVPNVQNKINFITHDPIGSCSGQSKKILIR